MYNMKVNPSVFSFLSAYKGFKPLDFKGSFSFLEVSSQNLKHTLILAYIYKNANFFILSSDENLKENIKKLNINNISLIDSNELQNKKFNVISINDDFSSYSNDKKERLINVLKNNLSENGYIFINYSSLPEKNSLAVFNRFLWETAKFKEEKFKELVEVFLNRPTRFLLENRDVYNLLNEFKSDSKNKQFFNKHFEPKFFFEVYEFFEKLDISFVGRLELELNEPEISLFPSHIPTVAKFNKIKEKESIIDFILNIGEHNDLWGFKANKGEFYDFIDENFFLLPRQSIDNLRRILLLPGGHRYHLTEPIFEPFYEVGDKPIRLSDHPDFRNNKESITKAFFKLAASGEFFICSSTESLKNISEIDNKLPEKFKLTGINSFILEKATNNLESSVLVSKITGGGAIFLTALETILLHFAEKFGTAKTKDNTLEYLKSLDKEIEIFGEKKPTKEIEEKDIEKVFNTLFKGRKALNLQRLGVLDGF